MTYVLTDRQKKLSIQVNEGTQSSPSLKNRSIGSGYLINTNETKVNEEVLFQLGTYFAELQIHPLVKIWAEEKGNVISE